MDNLKNCKEVLNEIKNENGEIEDIAEEIIEDEEVKEIEINKPTRRAFKKAMVASMLGLTLAAGVIVPASNIYENASGYVVEAKAKKKKDKKKPVIKFSGKSTITVEAGKSVKIPKATAKDNVDGNVTKKMTITVKKGKTSYKSIATKIKNGKKVKFTKTGTYKITYTVKDKAGNKATKTRTIKVVNKENDIAPVNIDPTTEVPTTEVPTTETPTTEAPTTEAPTTEAPTTEEPVQGPVVGDGKYEINKVTVGDKTYNIVNDDDFLPKIEAASTMQDNITIDFENYYSQIAFSKDSGLLENYNYLNYFGSITAKDKNNKDISDKIIIYQPIPDFEEGYNNIYLYVEDDYGNTLSFMVKVCLRNWRKDYDYDEDSFTGLKMLSKNPIVYADPRHYDSNGSVISDSLSTAKKLELVK